MAINKRIKNLKGFVNDTNFIKAQYTVPYGVRNNSRYKHIDDLLLDDSKVIKSTLGPVDLSIYPYEGTDLYTVTAADENRIDIIATKIYGSASFYWILCYINSIEDPLHIPTGTILFTPPINSLRRFPNPLS
jgi:hypothetical protein